MKGGTDGGREGEFADDGLGGSGDGLGGSGDDRGGGGELVRGFVKGDGGSERRIDLAIASGGNGGGPFGLAPIASRAVEGSFPE